MTRFLPYLLALLMLAGCVPTLENWDGPYIELTLQTGEDFLTKAGQDGTKEGVDRYNENLISWVDFFFYPGGDTDADATYYVHKESGKRRGDVLRVELNSSDINKYIFPSWPTDIRTCRVLAIVNYPQDASALVSYTTDSEGHSVPVLTGTSKAALEQRMVTTDFVGPTNHRQPRFMMSGEVDLTCRGRNQVLVASGTIDLARYACKLTVGVNVDETVKVYLNEQKTQWQEWSPMLQNMQIYLVDGVDNVTLAGEQPDEPDYFSYKNNAMRFAYMDAEDQIHFYFEKEEGYYQTYPTYMYPQRWKHGSTKEGKKEPYLKLVIPWARKANPEWGISSTEKQYYYKIVIPKSRNEEDSEAYDQSFLRNNWYHIDINVGILGAETDEAVVAIEGWCWIVDWQDKEVAIKHAQIGSARYLSVDRHRYELHNRTEEDLNYSSSHSIEIYDIRATRPYYGEKTSGDALGGKVKKAQRGATGDRDIYPDGSYYIEYPTETVSGWLHDTGTKIEFRHSLVTDYENDMFDYSPYTITFSIRHKDHQGSFVEQDTIVQYPPIIIEALPNSDKVYANNYWTNNGYVFIDGEQRKRRGKRREDGTYVSVSSYNVTYNEGAENDTTVSVEGEYAERAYRYVFEQGYTWNTNDGGTVRTLPDMMDLQWRLINYTGGSRDIFKIDVTVLPSTGGGHEFVVGDPRTDGPVDLNPVMHTTPETPVPFSENPGIEDFTEADGSYVRAQTSPDRSLEYYYPTDESDRTYHMLSPSYLIASKFGGTEYYMGVPFEEAQWRCASYQEDGFPAGRWRLPTRGEIRFIATLSAHKAFTFLFSKNGIYWSAHGAIHVLENDVEDSPGETYALVRCVYDAWYWGVTRLNVRNQFVWGDKDLSRTEP